MAKPKRQLYWNKKKSDMTKKATSFFAFLDLPFYRVSFFTIILLWCQRPQQQHLRLCKKITRNKNKDVKKKNIELTLKATSSRIDPQPSLSYHCQPFRLAADSCRNPCYSKLKKSWKIKKINKKTLHWGRCLTRGTKTGEKQRFKRCGRKSWRSWRKGTRTLHNERWWRW
jgi:hypothetical protein